MGELLACQGSCCWAGGALHVNLQATRICVRPRPRRGKAVGAPKRVCRCRALLELSGIAAQRDGFAHVAVICDGPAVKPLLPAGPQLRAECFRPETAPHALGHLAAQRRLAPDEEGQELYNAHWPSTSICSERQRGCARRSSAMLCSAWVWQGRAPRCPLCTCHRACARDMVAATVRRTHLCTCQEAVDGPGGNRRRSRWRWPR